MVSITEAERSGRAARLHVHIRTAVSAAARQGAEVTEGNSVPQKWYVLENPMRLVHPSLAPLNSPLQAFALLLLGQGFTELEFWAIAQNTVERIRGVLPFDLLHGYDSASTVQVYGDTGTGIDLSISQAGNELSIPDMAWIGITNYLQGQQVGAYDPQVASVVWPVYGRCGRTGSLVAVLKKSDSSPGVPAEFYGIDVAPDAKVPIVAVVIAGDYWHMPITRAIGQMLAGLADEFEKPDPEFEAVPDGDWVPPPNILFFSSAQAQRLANGEDPRTVLASFPPNWPISNVGTVAFEPRGPSTSPAPTRDQNNGVQFVEGGAWYRHGAVRCDFDCLMHRIPYSTQQPIQARIQFCKVCSQTISMALVWDPVFHPSYGNRLFLNSQQLRYEYVNWATPSANRVRDLSAVPFTETIDATAKSGRPHWNCQVTVDDATGLTVAALKLKDRTRDPFAAAEDVIDRISFKNLEVSFAGDSSSTPLDVSQAFANNVTPPALEIVSGDENDDLMQAGVKLTLTWDIQEKWVVEVVMALALRGEKNDFDPGGAAYACKFYPQISFRYRRPLTPRTQALPQVQFFRGTVEFVANNSIPAGTANIPPELSGMARGKITAALITDSNTADLDADNVYDLHSPCVGTVLPPPPFAPQLVPGIRGKWISGRLLAGVETCLGGTVRRGFKTFGYPPVLPYWSHLFDYGTPILPPGTAEKRFVGVYRRGELTPQLSNGNQSDGGTSRYTHYAWPLPGDQTPPTRPYSMYIIKYPRQGAFDSLHINADMGQDSQGRPIAAAPFCADKCIHLHWRWGTLATASADYPYAFKGWTDPLTEDGAAHSVPGTPLIPPNQHLEIAVQRLDDAHIQVQYDVRAFDPRLDEIHVLLEQGIGFAYSYEGIFPPLASGLANSVGATPRSILDPVQGRLMFHEIYQRIRWFDPANDHVANPNVQQFPAIGSGIFVTPSDLENL